MWEPSLPFDLADAGYEYTVLDDNHLRGGGVRDEDMWGTYIDDDQGRRLTIFGTREGPALPDPVATRSRSSSTTCAATPPRMAVASGSWATTARSSAAGPARTSCAGARTRWIDDCFEALEENADWLSDGHALGLDGPRSRRSAASTCPPPSYVEMTEWALPPDDARTFHDARRASHGATNVRRCRSCAAASGATSRRATARSTTSTSRCCASSAVAAMPPGEARDTRADHLYRGQSNDCYWHGLFGGIYMSTCGWPRSAS